ncbi:MAG: hypothetical protein WA304_12630 [Candidatus Cybelea sp.]
MKRTPIFTVGITACSVMLLVACSGAPNAGPTLPASQMSRVAAPHGLTLAGNDTRFFSGPQSRLMRSLRAMPAKSKVEKDFFVSTTGPEVLIYSNKTYGETGELTNGLSATDGVWVDKKGNIYVANVSTNVVEFKKGGSSPDCTYTGATDPINVTTDAKGNVYVADLIGGFVDEYAQCSNTIEKQFPADDAQGVAVDKSGDLFVSYGGSSLEEFKGGSTTGTPLGASVGESAGLIIDKKGNLIADDQAGDILVIAPPYSSATVLVSGLSDPFHCSLNEKEKLLFNANSGSGDITVYSYPSGSLEQTVNTSAAEGVGESPDAVF